MQLDVEPIVWITHCCAVQPEAVQTGGGCGEGAALYKRGSGHI